MQNLENLENLYDFLNQIYLRSPPVVRPEVGREPRGVQPFLCIAWFASIDTMGPAFFSASEHRGLRNCINSPLILTFLVQKSCHNYEK